MLLGKLVFIRIENVHTNLIEKFHLETGVAKKDILDLTLIRKL